jgi:oxygen-independent coproporphyrinogen-3 oxidase
MKDGHNSYAGFYLHIPFCRKKCPYCDFYSITDSDNYISAFIEAAILEINKSAESDFGRLIYDSIYIGGGAPSLLDPADIERLLDNIRANYNIDDDSEITLECNPSSLTENKIQGYRKAGINRISLGIQSFSDEYLNTLGRLHNSADAVKSYRMIKEAGYTNVSIDLIYGTPDQTISDWESDLEMAVELGPRHISAYNLIIENGTEFDRLLEQGKLDLPSDDEQSEMYDLLNSKLNKAGYQRYEISNFAKPGFECRHNLKYWTGKPYMGSGPSAVSFDGGTRRKNKADITEYIKSIQSGADIPADTEIIDRETALEESIISGLRMASGLSVDFLKRQFNYDILREKGGAIELLIAENMIVIEGGHIKLTDKALFISDSVMVKLI